MYTSFVLHGDLWPWCWVWWSVCPIKSTWLHFYIISFKLTYLLWTCFLPIYNKHFIVHTNLGFESSFFKIDLQMRFQDADQFGMKWNEMKRIPLSFFIPSEIGWIRTLLDILCHLNVIAFSSTNESDQHLGTKLWKHFRITRMPQDYKLTQH